MRKPEETGGIQYHFVNDAFFAEHGDDFILDKPFDCFERQDGDIYAYNKEHLRTAIKSYSNFIIHASVNNAIKISNEFKTENSSEIYIIFLDYNTPLTEEFFINIIRRPISEEDFYKRFYHAQKEHEIYRKNKGKFDRIFKADDPYDIVNQIEEFVLPKLEVMPTMPDKIPGPLSGEDNLYVAFRRRADNLIVKKDNGDLREEQLKEILSGCGLRITLNSKIRKTKRLCWKNYIDMVAKEQDISTKLIDLYPETLITSGYVLAPNEMIMCISNEHIETPIDVYAIASSRFSYSQLGLTIELATSVIHAGHKGQIHF